MTLTFRYALLAAIATQATGFAVLAQTNQAITGASGAPIIEQEFERLTAPRDRPEKRRRILEEILQRSDGAAQRAELATILSRPPRGAGQRFDDLMVQIFVENSLKAGDRAEARRLLAARCPEDFGTSPVEFWLAVQEGTGAVPLLTAALREAGTNASSRVLVGALGRAFPSLRKNLPEDRDFVTACEQWAKSDGSNYVVNLDYPYVANNGPIRLENDPAFKQGLFRAKRP